MSKKSNRPVDAPRTHKALVPPVWLVMVFTLVGIYATGLVYKAIVNGAWRGGIIGTVLLAVTVYASGTPLAASMWNHRAKKARRKAQEQSRTV